MSTSQIKAIRDYNHRNQAKRSCTSHLYTLLRGKHVLRFDSYDVLFPNRFMLGCVLKYIERSNHGVPKHYANSNHHRDKNATKESGKSKSGGRKTNTDDRSKHEEQR